MSHKFAEKGIYELMHRLGEDMRQQSRRRQTKILSFPLLSGMLK